MKLNLVPARTGLTWIKLGIGTFFKQPLGIVGLFFTLGVLLSAVAWLPVLGGIATLILLPTFILTLMAAAQSVNSGKLPMLSLIMGAARLNKQQIRPMLVLGALYALACVGLVGLSSLIDGGTLAKLYFMGGPLTEELLAQPQFQAAMWFLFGLQMLLSLLFWHAPALVHWHGITPLKSLFFSLVACYKNWSAIVLFGLGWIGLFVGISFLVSSLGLLAGNTQLAGVILAFTSLLILSMFFISLYFSFRDSFELAAPAAPSLS